MLINPVNIGLNCRVARLSPSVHKKKKKYRRAGEREKLTHAHLHFKALSSGAAESWFELSLILLLSRLSKFMAEEGVKGEGGSREKERRCFWFSLGTIFLSFFSVLSGGSDLIPCKCNVAQASGGMGRCRLQGTHPLTKTEREEGEDYNTRINSEIERERERGCAYQVSMNTRLSECGCKCVSTLKACSCTFVILSKGVLHFFELMFTCLLLVCVCVLHKLRLVTA